jgi:transposase-like protein
MKKGYKISTEVKQQILGRIKNDGVSVATAAKEHGISDATIYNWLTKGVAGQQPTLLEVVRLKKENKALLELVGEITLKLSESQKKR